MAVLSPRFHRPARNSTVLCAFLLVASVLCSAASVAAPAPATSPPQTLRETGLYLPGTGLVVDPAHLAFSPQYPLWTDGATKRRWLSLPPQTFIDASRPNAWDFPVGTRLWKEFSVGRAVETRYIERLADGQWRYATYIWNETGTDATLAPADGVRALLDRSGARTFATTCRASSTAARATRARQYRCSGSARCSSRLTEIRSHRTRTRSARSTCAGSSRAAWSAMSRSRCSRCRRESPPLHRSSALRSDICTATAATVTTPMARRSRSTLVSLRTCRSAPSRANRCCGRCSGQPAASALPVSPRDARVVAPGRPEASTLLWRIRSTNPQTQMPPLGVAGTRPRSARAAGALDRRTFFQPTGAMSL